MTDRTSMPIMSCAAITSIPWAAIEAHERQAMANHGQTLARLAGRGGLGVCEAVAIIEDRRWHRMDKAVAEQRLLELCKPKLNSSDNKGRESRAMKIYIAGPMTGIPDLNYPAFDALAEKLRAAGHAVINPAENPVPPCGSWLGYMRMSVAQVSTVDCVVMLPGWESSRGATLEHHIAVQLKLEVQMPAG